MKPLSGNQRPDLLTALMNMSLVLRLPRKMHLCRSSSNAPRLPSFLEMLQNPHVLLTLTRCTIPCACHAKRHLNVQKWSEPLVFLKFWLGNVLRATTACTFSTSQLPKSGPELVCFVRPQRRALFQRRNFQKWSGAGVFCTFWLRNVLRAATACNFSSLIWPDGSAPAALASLLFDPPEPQIIGKTQCFATFLPFRAPASSFFWLFLFSDPLFYSSLLSDSSHLCFSSVHIVGSLTSKLPSIICFWFRNIFFYFCLCLFSMLPVSCAAFGSWNLPLRMPFAKS